MALQTSPEQPAAVRTISRLLAEWIGRLGTVWVEGQVAEFRRRPGARNLYLTLRDTDADISLTVIADVAVIGAVHPPLSEGQRIVVQGRPDFYAARGTLSLRALNISAVGIGDLLAQLEALKATLAAEGLFATDRKQPLPFLPRTIGLICGRNAAAMKDVLVNARKRWPAARFAVREVAVQGINAVSEITAALHDLDAVAEVDVIIITRGGGSVEDLLPFSNETLVRAVAGVSTPVISAIGHEQDMPLLDLVADYRASTPTDAAKAVVPSLVEQQQVIQALRDRARSRLTGQLERAQTSVLELRARARAGLLRGVELRQQQTTHLTAQLRALSPQATLDRGYAIVSGPSGAIVRDCGELAARDKIAVRVATGTFTATVQDLG